MPEAWVVGRTAELVAVDAMLDATRTGFAVLVLEGEPGIGKTTVWREAVHRAEGLGACVLSCRPAAAEAKLSFAALTDILSPISRHAFELLPAPQRDALEVALLRSAPGGSPPPQRAAATGFLNLLRHLATTRPVLLAIDDAQWLDGPSRRVLEFAVRRLDHETVGLLYSLRPSAPAFDRGGASGPERRRLVLRPLSLVAIGEIMARRLSRPLPRQALMRIWKVSGGNPFYALEIGRLLEEGGLEPTADLALPIPGDFSELVAQQIRRLPARSRPELLIAAVLTAPEVRLVDLQALAPALEQRIISVDNEGRIEFAHPLFAAAVYSRATLGERRAAHRRAALLVEDQEQRARHLALATEGPDPAIAVELDQAAELAASRAAPDTAAELAELAARLTPESDLEGQARRWLQAAWFHHDAGDLERAGVPAQEAFAQAHEAPLRARALLLSAHLHGRRNGFADAIRIAGEALAIAGADDILRAGIEFELGYCCWQMGDSAGGAVHGRAAVQHSDASGDQEQLGEALALLAMCQFMDGSGLYKATISRAVEVERPGAARVLIFRPTYLHGVIQLLTQELDGALLALGKVTAQAVETGQEGELALLQFHLVETCLWRGDLAGASKYAHEAVELASLLDDPTASAVGLFASALMDAHAGRTELACQEASQAVDICRRMQFQVGALFSAGVVGFAELSAGNPAAAHAVLGPLTAQMMGVLPRRSLARAPGETGCGDPGFFAFLPDEIEALIVLGELDQAEVYLAPFEQSAIDLDRPWALAAAGRLRGALHAAHGEPELAWASFEQALAAHERLQMPFERGRTLLLAGQAYRRFKQHARAARALEEALALFEELEAPLWADKARRELARTGRPVAGAGALTETERLLAKLAATGLSNREVAAQAFVSLKTVEANLSRVYRKLGVRSRASLALALDAEARRSHT